MEPIFLFSLPRAGSTLIQRVLASHEDIKTVTESHLLLYFLYSLKDRDIYSTYRHELVVWAIQDFFHNLPNGEDDYLVELRNFYLRLYAKAVDTKVRYFLDKAPRYCFVVEDIINLFQKGKFVFIWRNPLGIVSSLMETYHAKVWSVYQYEVFLYHGLPNLITAYQEKFNCVYAFRYEDFILAPEETMQKLFEYLELRFDRDILINFAEVKLKGWIRDPYADLEEYQVIRKEPLQKWKLVLANPLRKAWARGYLRWLGRERLAIMGYNLDDLIKEVDELPLSFRFLRSDLYKMPYGRLYPWVEGRMLKHKIQAWRAGQRIYAHA